MYTFVSTRALAVCQIRQKDVEVCTGSAYGVICRLLWRKAVKKTRSRSETEAVRAPVSTVKRTSRESNASVATPCRPLESCAKSTMWLSGFNTAVYPTHVVYHADGDGDVADSATHHPHDMGGQGLDLQVSTVVDQVGLPSRQS